MLRLNRDFGIEQVVLVGDRGMISQAAVEQLRTHEGLAWITALKSAQIRQLVECGSIQMGLFDERNLFEITHPDYPDERLVVCRNEARGRLRAHKRCALLAATREELERVRAMVERGALRAAGKIGVRVGKVLNKFKMAKHFELDISSRTELTTSDGLTTSRLCSTAIWVTGAGDRRVCHRAASSAGWNLWCSPPC